MSSEESDWSETQTIAEEEIIGRSPLLRSNNYKPREDRRAIRNINRYLENSRNDNKYPAINRRSNIINNRKMSINKAFRHRQVYYQNNLINNRRTSSETQTITTDKPEPSSTIRVEVVHSTEEVNSNTKFKMELNTKYQSEIKKIQKMKKVEQVIGKVEITPDSTNMSLHKRFSIL